MKEQIVNHMTIKRKSDCCGCESCFNICPIHCIKMKEDKEGFSYPQINSEMCANCGLCIEACPMNQEAQYDNVLDQDPEVYACINKSGGVRLKSSSGGLFSIFAEKIIEKDGIVYGAAFGDLGMVFHIGVDNEKDIFLLRGSKYVQSSIGRIYCRIKEALEDGKTVLFSGTPCQNAGLKSFLHKEYEALYCVDFICHGVPSPKVWRLYLEHLENVFRCKIDDSSKISFRSKNKGWINFCIDIPFYSHKKYIKTFKKDLYMKAFLKNISLRPSCYKCHFKPSNDISDITIADFWGVEKILPEMFDNKGTSLVFVNSSKGKHLFESALPEVDWRVVNYKEVIQYNTFAYRSAIMPKEREIFFSYIDCKNIYHLMKKVTKETLYTSVKTKVKYVLK